MHYLQNRKGPYALLVKRQTFTPYVGARSSCFARDALRRAGCPLRRPADSGCAVLPLTRCGACFGCSSTKNTQRMLDSGCAHGCAVLPVSSCSENEEQAAAAAHAQPRGGAQAHRRPHRCASARSLGLLCGTAWLVRCHALRAMLFLLSSLRPLRFAWVAMRRARACPFAPDLLALSCSPSADSRSRPRLAG